MVTVSHFESLALDLRLQIFGSSNEQLFWAIPRASDQAVRSSLGRVFEIFMGCGCIKLNVGHDIPLLHGRGKISEEAAFGSSFAGELEWQELGASPETRIPE